MSESDEAGKAGVRPWVAAVLAGIVLLALAAAQQQAPADERGAAASAIVPGDAAAGIVNIGPALPAGMGPANGMSPQSPGPVSKFAPAESELASVPGAAPSTQAAGDDPAAGLTAQATEADPDAILTTDSPALNAAKNAALAVLARDLIVQKGLAAHSAGPGYDAPWIRDSFAWGMIPSDTYPQLAPYANSELRYWLAQQQPSGQWASNPMSGYFDETAILISAALDAYRVNGDRTLLAEALPRLRRGWAWLRGSANGRESTYLLWTPLPSPGPRITLPIAVDWADQVARRNHAAQLNLLWFRATQSLAVIESVMGNPAESGRYAAFAAGIRSDFNRLLWTTGTVQARGAAPAGAFGHYRSWYPAERDYFELDTNFQAILYGVADAAQSASILAFISAHADYLLGTADGAPPARTVYGNYAQADYAQIRSKLENGVYHNAYWLSTGGLAAAAYQREEQPAMQRRVLDGMAAAMRAGQGGGSASEWYDILGRQGGVSSYQWSARSYLNALYRAYAGTGDDWASLNAENLRVLAPGGEVIAQIRHFGKRLRVQTHGSGRVARVLVDGVAVSSLDVIPEALLRDGSRIDVYAVSGP